MDAHSYCQVQHRRSLPRQRTCRCQAASQESRPDASRRELLQWPLAIGLAGLLSQAPGMLQAARAGDAGQAGACSLPSEAESCKGLQPNQCILQWLHHAVLLAADTQQMRDALLSAIKSKGSDEEIEKLLRELSAKNPTAKPARSDKLYGKWKLLWASPNSEVANATRRNPFPSYSEQLVGEYHVKHSRPTAGCIQPAVLPACCQLYRGSVHPSCWHVLDPSCSKSVLTQSTSLLAVQESPVGRRRTGQLT